MLADELEALREAGWSVAVHNDYRLLDAPHTFWLFTHANGRWIKGEGRTDTEALAEAQSALRASEHAEPVQVTDADREAACSYLSEIAGLRGNDAVTEIRDDHPTLRSFAAHRAQGRAEAEAEIARRFDHIRSDLNNIVRALEDEGDRIYLGSTNDADELRQIARAFEDWLLRHERGEHRSKP